MLLLTRGWGFIAMKTNTTTLPVGNRGGRVRRCYADESEDNET
jgi:hypothetical protein